MTFFELVGGVIVFGVLWAAIPRVSFLLILGLYLKHQFGFFKTGESAVFSENFIILLLFIGIVVGAVIDIRVLKAIRKGVIK